MTRIGGCVYLRPAATCKLLPRHPPAAPRVAAQAAQAAEAAKATNGAADSTRQVHRRRLRHHVSS
ncbi:hypothetical protein CBM2617_A150044 [Cupriavidus taiwanensis]|nr:hypothetical protein CBM2617_A150044 [Cupriavidus taiwanensis]SOZ77023.1 hypothetical protein CBM2622_A140083 [Cupriavidus taiwanensis]